MNFFGNETTFDEHRIASDNTEFNSLYKKFLQPRSYHWYSSISKLFLPIQIGYSDCIAARQDHQTEKLEALAITAVFIQKRQRNDFENEITRNKVLFLSNEVHTGRLHNACFSKRDTIFLPVLPTHNISRRILGHSRRDRRCAMIRIISDEIKIHLAHFCISKFRRFGCSWRFQ